MDKLLVVGGVLLVLMLMLVLRASGLWIAMMLAFCGWVGQAFFIATQPGKNRFSAFWESKASWELAALPISRLAISNWRRAIGANFSSSKVTRASQGSKASADTGTSAARHGC